MLFTSAVYCLPTLLCMYCFFICIHYELMNHWLKRCVSISHPPNWGIIFSLCISIWCLDKLFRLYIAHNASCVSGFNEEMLWWYGTAHNWRHVMRWCTHFPIISLSPCLIYNQFVSLWYPHFWESKTTITPPTPILSQHDDVLCFYISTKGMSQCLGWTGKLANPFWGRAGPNKLPKS